MDIKALRFTRLNLVQPLRYRRDDTLTPFDSGIREASRAGWEMMFSLIIDSARGQDFQAAPGGRYFAAILNAGKIHSRTPDDPETGAAETVDLPAGPYFFAQMREIPGEETIVLMALELQKEGLWQRLVMENRVYLRYLYEDGRAVTQLFRPLAS
ncbi:MAG: hypothetical protein LBC88_07565 [Spirochaetaceae bacterium]|jgi:hypothetical protein|nr:hypothetical protein [Spirochaetaceae bacterium]